MKFRALMLATLLCSSACTFSSQENVVKSDFNPPLVYQSWKMDTSSQKGINTCTLTSGYNGISVILSKKHKNPDIAVRSTRLVIPGMVLTATLGNRKFEAYDEFFPPRTARALVSAMSKNNGMLYLEWYEKSGSQGGTPVRTQNMVKLDEFAPLLDQCRKALK